VENPESIALQKIAAKEGLDLKSINHEISLRKEFLEKLAKNKVFEISAVHKEIQRYCQSG
jgi:hypothetical protein